MTKENSEDIDNEEALDAAEESEQTADAGSDDPMAKLQEDFEKFRDLALRSQADLDNYRKRAAREKDEAIRYANESLLERLLPVIDNFELGLQAAKQGDGHDAILQGLGMVQKQLDDFLSSCGVSKIETKDQEFDPNIHEAIAQVESDLEEGTIVDEVRCGYMIKDRLLRAAKVTVSKGSKEAAE